MISFVVIGEGRPARAVLDTIIAAPNATVDALVIADAKHNPLAEFADPDAFCQRVLAFALAYADQVRRDYARFVGMRPEIENVSNWAKPA